MLLIWVNFLNKNIFSRKHIFKIFFIDYNNLLTSTSLAIIETHFLTTKPISHMKSKSFLFLLILLCALQNISHAQSRTITGKVTDEQLAPIPNVSVIVQGSSKGTTTNADGVYSIAAKDGDIIEFTSVGFVSATLTVSASATTDVQMIATVSALTDVVVVGYGTQRKKDLTGSVAVVDMNELKSQPSSSPVEALQGKATGVQIINDGSPGATPQIRIRGFSTINNNDPLFIIDGMPYTGKLSWLSAEDIESMQVLKDASAASIYGSRANNGVVIITTKKGRKGPPKINLDIYYGTQRPISSSFPEYMTPMQFAQNLYAAFNNSNTNNEPAKRPGLSTTTGANYGSDPNNPTLPEYLIAGVKNGQDITAADADPSKYRYTQNSSTFYQITKANQAGTNWFKEITNPAPMQNYQLTVLGGGENSTYSLSGGYFNQEGTIKFTGFKRYTIRANTSFTTLGDRLTLGENIQYSHTSGYGFATNPNVAGSYQGEGSPIGWAYRIQTIIPVYDIMGNFAGSRGSLLGNADNPLSVLYRGKDNVNTNNQFFGSAYADLKVIQGLNLKTVYGVRYDNYGSVNIGYPNPERAEGSYDNNPLNEYQGYATEWTWTNTLTYKNKFGGKHDLTLLAGTEAVQSKGRTLSGTGNSFFIFGDINYYYLNAASTGLSSSSNGYISSLFSIFGRADYSLMDKYLLSATIRRDGSSNFGPSFRYGNFPAASAAWRVSNENFLKEISWISELKLRAGYGTTGNQTIPSFQFLRRYQSSINLSSYPIGGKENASGIWTSNYDNPDVKWEQLKSWNFGLDFSIISNKIDGAIDWYHRKTTDMLYPVPLPAQGVGGGASPYVNIGSMSNKGVELALNYHYNADAPEGTFKFNVGSNISRNVNKVTELAPTVKQQQYGGIRSLQTSIILPGQPFGAFYGYKIIGIYQSQQDIASRPSYANARVGGPIYADVSEDGIVDDKDRTVIGSPHPDFIYSLSFNASYHHFDLSMFFNGSQGNQIFDVTRYYTDFSAFDGAVSTRMLNAWSPTNTASMTPSPYRNRPALELQANSYYVQDGSFFRMKLLQLGYTFPAAKFFKDKIQNLRAYVSGSNLFTITKYSGLDPEVTQFSSDFTAPGVDLGVYPASRQFILGVNVTF